MKSSSCVRAGSQKGWKKNCSTQSRSKTGEIQNQLIKKLLNMHHVSTEKGIDINMLVEKEYPLSRGTLTLMLIAKLLVKQDNEMSREKTSRKIILVAKKTK
ncbi:hypothetical protein Tco_0084735 [Tanacetum coccineum]